ncbi:Hypothetical_protein [Hexamita inflata]|uniref:Hypothetical_protein n=1 Tax=Hexamita inflata TaxID=28002 RepID=A0AA86PX52_9EUKA|nr:Hypothetical protein HINF_LOCUS33417 [Hexamita inflata]
MLLVLYTSQFSCTDSVLGVKVSNTCPMVMQCKSAHCLFYPKTDIGHSACKNACYAQCFTSPFKTSVGGVKLNGYYYCPHKTTLIVCSVLAIVLFGGMVLSFVLKIIFR